jgi:DNA transposition AAA+ family ATPase
MNTRIAGKAEGTEYSDAHGPANPAPERNMSRDVMNIGLNIFKNGISNYSEREKELLEWLWGYTIEELHQSRSALAEAVNYDYTVIYKIFTGGYDASLDAFCEAIERLKKKVASGRTRLVKTYVAKRIIEALDYARDMQSMIAICGPTGRSKTFTAKWWSKENNHGRSRYIRAQSGCTRRTIVTQLCQVSGIGINGKKTGDLESRLFKAFDYHNVIIVDEAGHLLPRGGLGTTAIEFLRDMHDMCECAVVLIFTDVYLDEMRQGRLSAYYEQFIGRIKFELHIPKEVRRDEVVPAVKSFVKDPSAKMIELALKIARARDGKLRTLFEDLQRAKAFAESQGREMSEKDLKLASDWRASGGIWDNPED